MDFSQEELSDAADRLTLSLLERAGVEQPPVDVLRVARELLRIPVEFVEPDEDDDSGRSRRSRRDGAGIVLTSSMTEEQRHAVAAGAIARMLLPDLLRKLDITPGTESKALSTHFRALLAARLLVPLRMLRMALRTCKFDLFALKEIFSTVGYEAIALRLLDLEDPSAIAIVDDGVVAMRRGNRFQAVRKLTAAEQHCLDQVMDLDTPQKVRLEEWTAWGWPIPDRPFRRVILRAVPDDV